ncbi:MAG TPA: adenylate/guanylate cyclase domain-containing protein [Nocardioidaceae bacterium]
MTERTTSRAVVLGLLAGALVLPLAGLALLLLVPAADMLWEHHPAHFWLVLLSAGVAAVLAYATGTAAVLRGDARVLAVSLAFLSSAGFLGLHALATPGVLLDSPNPGFVVATPVGIAIGSVLAAWSTVDQSGERAVSAVRRGKQVRLLLLLAMAVWVVLSLGRIPPLDGTPDRLEGLPGLLAVPAVLLYAFAAVRYLQLWGQRRSPMLLAMMAAFVLLAEAMVAIAFARNWHLSWWEWHLLLLAAFALVAVGARMSWREERFADLYLDETGAGTRVMSVLFADLQGFTTWSENHRPDEVTAMLNEYFAVAVPAVVSPHGGDVDRIIGDALMVTFNKRGDQPDHAHRAAAAALALQEATSAVAEAHPGWPRFRVGVNSGPVTVSVLGTGGGRTHTVIGDTVNTASRIEGKAPAGGVAIGPATKAELPEARTSPLGALELKGKAEPVEAHLLVALG